MKEVDSIGRATGGRAQQSSTSCQGYEQLGCVLVTGSLVGLLFLPLPLPLHTLTNVGPQLKLDGEGRAGLVVGDSGSVDVDDERLQRKLKRREGVKGRRLDSSLDEWLFGCLAD